MKTHIKLTGLLTLVLLNCLLATSSKAQQTVVDSALLDRVNDLEKNVNYKKPGEDHFMVVGLATFGFVANKTTTTVPGQSSFVKTNSMGDADHYEFSPMLLWRHGSKFLMEFEPSFDGNALGVNWAAISYFAAPGLIIRGGYFVLPFGTYNKRLAAGWIDKLATDPMGVADVPPASDFGVEVEGGFPMGNMKWNYDVSLTNGMQLLQDGTIQNAGIVDNNMNKTVTGRLGLLPFSNSSLELGVSGMFGKVADAADLSHQAAQLNAYAVDLNYVKLFNPIMVNIKGQYNYINVNRQSYTDQNDSSYSFDNTSNTYFAQIALRPSGASSKLLKNLEASFRVGNYVTPNQSLWGYKATTVEGALLYWLSWRTVLKAGYVSSTTDNSRTIGDPGTKVQSNSFILQFSIQL